MSADAYDGSGPEGTGETIAEERRAERRVAVSFLVCAASAVGLAVVYLRGGNPQLEGLLLGLALASIAVGFVMWANHLMPRGPFVDSRHDPSSDEDDL
ncbi:MAG: ubiquinol-cytochrome c reductase iron-sulfur subunit, partial [Actinomycetota bacterium]|nr:ubiquinol-cytochrome c reductase iron-sulfur subunit [Actinomycetota bacterium]